MERPQLRRVMGPRLRTESQMVQYRIAGTMIAVGVVLWAVMWGVNRRLTRRGQDDD